MVDKELGCSEGMLSWSMVCVHMHVLCVCVCVCMCVYVCVCVHAMLIEGTHCLTVLSLHHGEEDSWICAH